MSVEMLRIFLICIAVAIAGGLISTTFRRPGKRKRENGIPSSENSANSAQDSPDSQEYSHSVKSVNFPSDIRHENEIKSHVADSKYIMNNNGETSFFCKSTDLPSAAGPVPESVQESELTPSAFAEQYLKKSNPAPEVIASFEKLKGTDIVWHGILRNAYPYQSDFVFGNRPGVRVTMELGEFTDLHGTKRKFFGILSFSPEDLPILRERFGKELQFRAEFLKFTAFSREIYLQKAKFPG